MKASAEFQISSEKEHPPLQDLPALASSAEQSPAMPLHNSSEEAFAAGNLEKSTERSTQGFKFYLHTRQEAKMSVTTTRMHEPQVLVAEKDWHPENQSPSQVNGLEQHQQPGNQQPEAGRQSAPRDQESLCDVGDVELHEESQPDQEEIVSLEATVKADELQMNTCLPHPEKSFLPSGCFSCSSSETMMEIDTVEQSLVALHNSAGSQKATVQSTRASNLTSENPLMEVETSKYNPLFEHLNNSISTQDLQPLENNVEMSGINKEDGSTPPSISVCGNSQPSLESAEDSHSSVTAALKELHELLVISCKPTSENTSEIITCQSETTTKSQAGVLELSGRWTESEQTHSDQCLQVSCHQATSESVKTEVAGTASCASIEDREYTGIGSPGEGLPTDKGDVLRWRDSVSESCSVAVTSTKSSNQLQYTLGTEISPRLAEGEEDAHSKTSEQTKSLPSSSVLVKDFDQDKQNPVTDRPETREDVCPEAAKPALELEPPATQPPSGPSILSHDGSGG